MKELLEQGYGVLLVGIVAGIGAFARFFLIGYYGRLEKACRVFGQAKNKTISYIREDLSFRSRNNIGMKSVTVYTEYRLAESKVCGIRLGTLEGITQQSLLLVVLSGVLLAFAGVLWNCNERQILFVLFAGGVSFLGLFIVDLVTGLREKHKRIRLAIRDYIENGERMEHGAAQRESGVEKAEKKNRKAQKPERKITKAGCEKRTKSRKPHGKAQEEKRRLTEELLRERRQMEAREFAELRRRECVTPEVKVQSEAPEVIQEAKPEAAEPVREETTEIMERVREEAAATQFTYEDLLSEVLAEYLV